jgi:cytochrome c
VSGDDVVYVESMELGVMVRDLAEGHDGRVVAWTGERLFAISRGLPSPGAEAYGSCAACHGTDLDGTELGPSLRGIVGREIATRAGFEYSAALRSMSGAWDEERLDAFLEEPEAVAPGNSMAFPGLSDEGARAALIDYLQTNR